MNARKAAIFLNGQPPSEKLMEQTDFKDAYIICADGAYNYLKKYFKPDLILGDFDSIEQGDIPLDVETERFPIEKNDTDSAIAVKKAAELGLKTVEIFGAFGKRLDHEMVNYSLLALSEGLGVASTLIDEQFDVCFLTKKRPFKENLKENKIISLVPYSDKVHIKYTKGLKYPAVDKDVDKLNIFTTSNLSLGGECEYVLSSGMALLFKEK